MNARRIAILMLAFLLAACQAPTQPTVPVEATFTPIQPVELTSTPTLSPEQLLSLAQDALNRGDWNGAILLLDLVLTQNPEDTQALLLRGSAYRELGDFAQSISNYDQALAIDPELPAVYHN